MYAPTEELTRIANNSRDAVTAALNAWAEAAQRYAADFDAKHPVPDAAETQAAIDTAYDLAGKLLAEQHAFATHRHRREQGGHRGRGRALPHARAGFPGPPPPDLADREPVRPPLGRALPVTAHAPAEGPSGGGGPCRPAFAR